MEPSDPGATTDTDPSPADDAALATTPDETVEDELLIEEISIDGMCGVY